MDVLGSYLEENTIKSAGNTISCASLYENYKKWCQDNGHSPYSKNKFGRRLYERHITKGTTPRGEIATLPQNRLSANSTASPAVRAR